MTLSAIFAKLRTHNRKSYLLYLFCNFIALLMITAYSSMMFSPTVMNILPEGGDSRKQLMAIFVLACVGCIVFTIYAASLFYRMKSKEIGTMMLLGAPRSILSISLLKEVSVISLGSSLAGTALGLPFAWLIWQLFRLLLVDSPEMVLRFDLRCYLVSMVFAAVSILATFLLALIYLRKTNVIDVVNTQHRNEPLRGVRKWFGPVGILLILFGAVLGYYAGSIYMRVFSAYPPAWVNMAYAPIFIGLYMFLLHVVVNGFGISRRKKYKGLISRSMMKFQGRQTVNNMLVVTVLIAGGLFAAFYAPMLGTSASLNYDAMAFDYGMHYPVAMKTSVPDEEALSIMAQNSGLKGVKEYRQAETAILAVSGQQEIEDENGKFHYEYFRRNGMQRFLSESAYNALSGASVKIPRGKYAAINPPDQKGSYMLPNDADYITNMVTGQELPISFSDYVADSMLGDRGYYILDDEDYHFITEGLTEKWMEETIFFNADGKNHENNYDFSRKFFDTFVDAFDASPESMRYLIYDNYDFVAEAEAEASGQIYEEYLSAKLDGLSYDNRDSSDFRMYWMYMPQSRTLDSHEFLKTMAVYLMIFIFIALICLAVSLIICHTRSLTVAINNRYVFDDLRRLGASPAFLLKEVKGQCSKVFVVPSAVGTSVMYLLYGLIMYANDNQISVNEITGMVVCLMVVFAVAMVIYLVYRLTLRQMCRMLNI
ncbi:MAG: FtsX-like permease family protein [Anaerovoracaceae bacterium]